MILQIYNVYLNSEWQPQKLEDNGSSPRLLRLSNNPHKLFLKQWGENMRHCSKKNCSFLRMVWNDVTFSWYSSKEFQQTLESFLCWRKWKAYKLEKFFNLPGRFLHVANNFNCFHRLASCEMIRDTYYSGETREKLRADMSKVSDLHTWPNLMCLDFRHECVSYKVNIRFLFTIYMFHLSQLRDACKKTPRILSRQKKYKFPPPSTLCLENLKNERFLF